MTPGGLQGRSGAASPAPLRAASGRWRVVGLDLAGSPARDTGCCLFSSPRRLRASILKDDKSIVSVVRDSDPDLVIIDAPLSLPRGRRTIGDRSGPHFRECDQELRRMGIRFFPLTLGPMRMLTVRGMHLANRLARMGFVVREGYPGGAQDVLGIPRKQSGRQRLQARLVHEGLGGDLLQRALSHDELDAVTLGWVGYLYLQGKALEIGDAEEGTIVLPLPRRAVLHRVKPN